MKLSRKAAALGLAISLTLVAGFSAHAIPTIKYRVNGGAYVTVMDNMAGDMDPATAGGIVIVGVGSQFSFAIQSATTKPAAGSAELPVMSLNINATAARNSPTTKTLELWFTETDFGPTSASIITDLSSTGLGGWMGRSYVDDANVSFGTATLLASLATSNTGDAGPVNSLLPVDPFTTYSVTTYLKLTIDAGKTANGTLTLRSFALPDGGSTVAFLGMALVAVEGIRRKLALI